jgi:hypothetical protein
MQGGGLVGGIDFSWDDFDISAFQNCFWDKEISPEIQDLFDEEYKGEIIDCGKTTAQMKTKQTFTEANWDFETIWDIDETINDGYPFLRVPNVSIEAEIFEGSELINIFPNPAINHISMDVHPNSEIKIYDISGELVFDSQITGTWDVANINIANLAAGVYYVVVSENGKYRHGSFVKK